jgi:hypothetical protein
MAGRESMSIGEEEICFFFELGNAMAAWAFVEGTLRELVLLCTEPGPDGLTHKALAVGFVSIETFRAKLNFTEGLFKRRYPEHSASLEHLAERISQLSRKRNKLAHWSTQQYPENAPGRRFMLVPWMFKKKRPNRPPKRPSPPDGSLSLREIRRLRLEFICAAISIQNFCDRAEGRPERHERHREQAGEPPPIAKFRTQIRAELAGLIQAAG